jgi:acyl transferase domain-containing protein
VSTIEPIAIVGIDCRFPGAIDKEEFWRNLCNQVDAISTIPGNRWDSESFFSEDSSIPGTINTHNGGFITDADAFDAEFFGISPREAEAMDPQQRLLLQTTWRAIEDSGVSPNQLDGSNTGVFMGIMGNEWAQIHMSDYQKITPQVGVGNGYCMTANRISYHFNFRGPSLAIDTACSSALVAVHHACNSLRLQECDYALAGGVNLILTPSLNIFYTQAGLSASDGRCKSFSNNANGIGRGEGVGLVVLRRLSDAIADNQRIYAVIKGGAINQDGRSNGITAPNRWAQQEVIEKAYHSAQVKPEQITFIEAHGTGTILGDLIEVKALKHIQNVPRSHPCYLGSVKSNVGHLEGAAGIVGLIKVALALHHKYLPPTLHCSEENAHLKLDNNVIQLLHQPVDLVKEETVFAGLSSFGLGGTNAHLVLQSFEPIEKPKSDSSATSTGVFTLSAKTSQGLNSNIKEQLGYLIQHPELDITSVCHSSNSSKSHLPVRIAYAANSINSLTAELEKLLSSDVYYQSSIGQIKPNVQPKVAFLFTGQGSQYSGMAHTLYQNNSAFRAHLDACDFALSTYLGISIKEVLFQEENQELLNQTQFTQPAIFAIQYALAKLWQALGINPQAIIGHSVGEYAGACIAGVMSLDDAAYLICMRGKLMQGLPANGKMLAVKASPETFQTWLTTYQSQISIAADNGIDNIVLAGSTEVISEIQHYCQQQGIKAKPLTVSHAFHSPLMQPILSDFRKNAQEINFSLPKIKIISTLTGLPVTKDSAMDAEYWTNHIAQTVKYYQACQALCKLDITHAIEIGAKPILVNLGQAQNPSSKTKWLPSIQSNGKDIETLFNTVAQLYLDGAKVNWTVLYDNKTHSNITLPNYKFQTDKRYWFNNKIQQHQVSYTTLATTELESLPSSKNKDKENKTIREIVISLTASVAGYQESEISLTGRFSEDLGYDSMMLMELKNKIEKSIPELGKLPVTELLENVTAVSDLVNYLSNKIQ